MRKKAVFAVIGKRPLKGFSKTRLAHNLGEDFAYQFYQLFIEDFFSRLAPYTRDYNLYFFGTPSGEETKKYFEEIFRKVGLFNYKIYFQDEVPFFRRLENIFQKIYEERGVVEIRLTGTDIPDFPFEYLQNLGTYGTFGRSNSVIIGPDTDKGFYYLSASSEHSKIFQIEKFLDEDPSQVLQGIFKQCQNLGLQYHLLPEWSDIDTLDDLKEFVNRKSTDKSLKTLSYFQQLAEKKLI